MKKKCITSVAVLLMLLLAGCGRTDDNSTVNDENYVQEYTEWEFLDADETDRNACVYEYSIESLKESLCTFEYVDNVEIEPKSYTEYVASDGVELTVTLNSGAEITDDKRESIENFVYSMNFFDKYVFVYK